MDERKPPRYTVGASDMTPEYKERLKEYFIAVVSHEGSCVRADETTGHELDCLDCPNNFKPDECTHDNTYKMAVEWLYNNGFKEDLVELLI